MKLIIDNDGKENYMSFEATLEGGVIDLSMAHGTFDITAWGRDEVEARKNLKDCLQRMITSLTEFLLEQK